MIKYGSVEITTMGARNLVVWESDTGRGVYLMVQWSVTGVTKRRNQDRICHAYKNFLQPF
jgi:hypothetical protein